MEGTLSIASRNNMEMELQSRKTPLDTFFFACFHQIHKHLQITCLCHISISVWQLLLSRYFLSRDVLFFEQVVCGQK